MRFHPLVAITKFCSFWLGVCLAVMLGVSGCETAAPSIELVPGKSIAEIQGAGHQSPWVDQPVTHVHGIVTVLRANGFYMQSLKPDQDPATSEGIFVFKGLIPSVKPGDEVWVTGIVDEWVPGGRDSGNLSMTQLRYPTVEVLSRGNPLPTPVIIGEGGRIPPTEMIGFDPDDVSSPGNFDPEKYGLDFYESLEGMLVQVNNAVVVGPTNQYNEIVILPDMGTWASVRTPRGGIVIRENDFNPERIILADGLRELPLVSVGDYATEAIIGVIDYSFGIFKLQPIEPVHFNSGGLVPGSVLAPVEPGQLRVVSYNVDNLSAREPKRIAVLADQIVNLMASPDIIGLQEVQDNDGNRGSSAISADQTYQAIIDAIQLQGGPQYAYVDIDPLPGQDGGVPDGNIRVGFIYRLDRGLSLADAPHGDAETAVEILDIEGKPALSLNPGRIEPGHDAFIDSRKPLVVTFIYESEPIFIVNNHLNSKIGDGSLFGAIQPLVFETEVQRLTQAQVIYDFVAALLTVDPDSHVIVLGDLNDFQFSPPVQVLRGELLLNLIDTLPVEARYTYVYQGNSQALDHILVSDSLAEMVTDMEILHINAEFDYKQRFSDHDVLVATFTFD
jgi:uncharacterized protein